MIYLDNASTTHAKPKSVTTNVIKALTKYSVNAGRGGYPLSIQAGNIVLDTRQNLSDFFGLGNPNNVIFTSSCTMAINLAIRGTMQKGGHIVATVFEHNSVLRTLDDIKTKFSIDYSLVEPNKHGDIDVNEIENAIKPNTYMVITIHASNVTGHTQDIYKIGNFVAKHNLIYMVDAAQSAGHIGIDVQAAHINLLTIAGHKGLYAPQGIGVLLINNVKVLPLLTGGTGTHSANTTQPTDTPEGLESGTLALPAIMGLNAGLNYVKHNFVTLNKKIAYLTRYLIDELNKIPNVKVYSKYNDVGVVSFNIDNIPSSEIADQLYETHKICVRSGLQCAPQIHKYHDTLQQGMVRISISSFNTKQEIITAIIAIKELSKKLG